jgi:hypothetical protein
MLNTFHCQREANFVTLRPVSPAWNALTHSADSKRADPLVGKYHPGDAAAVAHQPPAQQSVKEIGGRKDGTDPTRFGDWEKHGRCIDF